MWIARDKEGDLWLFTSIKPYRLEEKSKWEVDEEFALTVAALNEDLFPDLKWEDEPIEVFLNTGYDMANQINHVWAMLKCTQEDLDKAHQTIQYYRTKFEALKKIIDE